MSKDKARSRLWFVLLYPDNQEHQQTMELIKSSCHFVGILHDKDLWTAADQAENSQHIEGQPKKEHYHLLVKFPEAVWNTALAKQWNIEERWLRKCGSLKDGVFYLVHRGYETKFQYSPDGFFGSLTADAKKILEGKKGDDAERILSLIRAGKSNLEIIEEIPTAYTKTVFIDTIRQSLLYEQFKDKWRNLEVTYIWGDTAVGKTRSVMEQYGYSNVYRVTNYMHPFDGYKGEDVILFDEFRSSLSLPNMLMYLDGYPVALPCRYNDKQACYTKVYIISNIPLHKQYLLEQEHEPETFAALKRRIHNVQHMLPAPVLLPPDPVFDPISIFGDNQ